MVVMILETYKDILERLCIHAEIQVIVCRFNTGPRCVPFNIKLNKFHQYPWTDLLVKTWRVWVEGWYRFLKKDTHQNAPNPPFCRNRTQRKKMNCQSRSLCNNPVTRLPVAGAVCHSVYARHNRPERKKPLFLSVSLNLFVDKRVSYMIDKKRNFVERKLAAHGDLNKFSCNTFCTVVLKLLQQ